MHYLQYHNTQENKGVNWEGTKAAGGGWGETDIIRVDFTRTGLLPPAESSWG